MTGNRNRNNDKQQQHHHPYGTTLLSRDRPENRARWGPDGVGYVDVAPTVCAATGENKRQQRQLCPHYHHRGDAGRTADNGGSALATPIHLLVASYRDQLCPRTLYNAFRRAENPHRIFVRIVDQTDPDSDLVDDAGCFERFCREYHDPGDDPPATHNCQRYAPQVRTIHVDAALAKGPTDARSKLSAMIYHDFVYKNDHDMLDFRPVEPHDFCLQIDSHMDFSDRYDTELVLMHHRTRNDYAVLSTYVADIAQNNKDVRTVPNLCMVQFTSTIRNWGTKECIDLRTPKLTNALWGAGLSFHRCHAELNVPVDPYLDNVFDGEEGSRGMRFFTHGYDVYTPDRVLVTHDYHHHQSNPVVHTWQHSRQHQRHMKEEEEGAEKTSPDEDVLPFLQDIERERPKVRTFGTERVNLLLGIGPAIDNASPEEVNSIRRSRYGLGTRRTLEQAAEFSGIHFRERTMVANKCGNLEWVPYDEEESGDYGVQEVLSRELAGGDRPVAAAATSQKKEHGFAPRNLSSEQANANVVAAWCGVLLAAGVLVRVFLVVVVRRPKKKKGDRHTN